MFTTTPQKSGRIITDKEAEKRVKIYMDNVRVYSISIASLHIGVTKQALYSAIKRAKVPVPVFYLNKTMYIPVDIVHNIKKYSRNNPWTSKICKKQSLDPLKTEDIELGDI